MFLYSLMKCWKGQMFPGLRSKHPIPHSFVVRQAIPKAWKSAEEAASNLNVHQDAEAGGWKLDAYSCVCFSSS